MTHFNKHSVVLLAVLSAVCLITAVRSADSAEEPAAPGNAARVIAAREITNVTGTLYRFRDGGAATPFLVTSAGIILGDPLSLESARWLKAELDRRFNLPVKYVIYSHHHWDHASGAAAFADSAQIVAHENTPAAIRAFAARLSTSQLQADQRGNRNGKIEHDEARGAMLNQFSTLDRNADGSVTAAEAMQDVIPPTRTYSAQLTLTLGGKTVVLVHPGDNHSDDSTVILFPDERVLFGADFFWVNRLPNNLLGTIPLEKWVASFKKMETLDFDILFPAHGGLGTKADLVAHRKYFEDLDLAIKQGIAAGKTLEQIQASDVLVAYRNVPGYETLRNQSLQEAYDLAMQAK